MLAFDKSTSRRKDDNGFLHVGLSHISKEAVNPYMGREIPGWQELGLTADRVYNCYRKGSELKAAAESFNGLPILWGHHAESAEDPKKKERVGSMGTDAAFKPPYLDNSLIFTDQKAIDAIESGERVELSCSYRWKPVVTPGNFNGQAYDMIMTEIRGNHLGLVEEGRAGGDVMVHDEKPKGIAMTIKERAMKLAASITGLLANDAGIERKEDDIINKIGEAVKEFEQVHKEEKAEMEKEVKGMDAEGLKKAYGAMDEEQLKAAKDTLEEFMKSKKEKGAEDEDPEAKDAKDEEAEKKAKDEEEAKKKADDEAEEKKGAEDKAMDKKLKLAKDEAVAEVTAKHKAMSEAAADVRPVIGQIDALSFDSVEAIYGKALELQNISTKGFEPEAYKGMFSVLKASRSTKAPAMAMDSKTELSGAFAGLKNVKIA